MMKYKKEYKSSFNKIVQNKRARHEYFIEQELEAGLLLQGWEVKSLRARIVHINDSYVYLKNNEAFLFGAIFQPIIVASSNNICYNNPSRTRKLLLKRQQLNWLYNKIHRKGYTIITLSLYWKKHLAKIQLGIAKGKKKYDKRHSLKEREWLLDKARILKKGKISV